VPDGAWHLSGQIKLDSEFCLDTLYRLAGIELPTMPAPQFIRSMEHFSGSLGSTDVPWRFVLPENEHRDFTKKLVTAIGGTIGTLPFDYYTTVWVPGNAVIRALRPGYVDKHLWKELIDVGEGNMPALRSFEPNRLGRMPAVEYDRFRTLTGRLTVATGPQILTLKREHRKILRSRHGNDGQVISLDFAALEARILLYEHGGRCDEPDLYQMIARELGYERKAIKGAVISELYGSSKRALGVQLGIEGAALDEFVQRVKRYFSTHELLARIKAQFLKTGKIMNRHGRPIVVDEPLDNLFIAYYGQSSGVDITLLGFRQVIDQLTSVAPRSVPIFLLHDAILIDAHKDEVPAIRAINSLRIKGYVQRFMLKADDV
jgi:hypothetical protein